MCTFFWRLALIALLTSGCSRHRAAAVTAQPAPDTVRVALPIVRLQATAETESALDSATLALVERRVMARLASMMRAEQHYAIGAATSGITPARNAAPRIEHGLLGVIEFKEDGSWDEAIRQRLTAIAHLLPSLEGGLTLRVRGAPGADHVDVAMARARRVYRALLELDPQLYSRPVTIRFEPDEYTREMLVDVLVASDTVP